MTGKVDELLPLLLSDVTEVKRENNNNHCGAYGYVFEVAVGNRVCIAKKPHTTFIHKVSEDQKKHVLSKFRGECLLLSKLRHPNIVQFIGVYYGSEGSEDIALVMEKLDYDLAEFLKSNDNIKDSTKLRILQDVSHGLVYLHQYNKVIVHRDLSARNILLTKSCRAKIADVGMAKLIDEKDRQSGILTTAPGNVYYMPPEALLENPRYTSKLDIFSFGHLSLHTILGDYPVVYEVTMTDEKENTGSVQAMKRQSSLDKIGKDHCLYKVILDCLKDDPEERPTASQLNETICDIVFERAKQEEVRCVQI